MTSIEQQVNLVVVAQPINAIKDADILERLWNDFEDQLRKAKTIASEHLRLGGDSSVAPIFPMPETNASDNANETSRKCDLYDDVAHMQTLRKRGRKTTSKVLFQVPFSFQPPEFCLKENINLEIYYIHSASQKTLRSHNEVLEFLLDVEIPRKGGSKKAKVVGAVDNQVSGSASHESSRRKEMSFASQIVNKMNSSNEEEHKGGMESMYKMKSSDEKGSNELDNKEHILRYQHANNGEVARGLYSFDCCDVVPWGGRGE
ncbi:hypothetical protein JHK87_023390 [Glycine soja]|nr:hypothetical protein JHK87_023390 [Glycine soja]